LLAQRPDFFFKLFQLRFNLPLPKHQQREIVGQKNQPSDSEASWFTTSFQ
jgi:hypothetical protein